MMLTRTLPILVATLLSIPALAHGQAIDWNELPEPKHLEKVLDTDTFLRRGAGSRYVQIGAFKNRTDAVREAERISEAGLRTSLARQGSWHLVLMPETERNRAEVLAGWARRSGYSDAYIRRIR